MPLTPEQRVLRARAAAYAKHAKHDARESTVTAREAFRKRFLDEVDPNRTLPQDERERRVEAARRAYYTRLAYLSSKARSKR
jgi:hypothetical protein